MYKLPPEPNNQEPQESQDSQQPQEAQSSQLPQQSQEQQLPQESQSPQQPEKVDIDAEWAEALHIEYDAEEAKRRAEKAATPPVPPASPVPPMPDNQGNPMRPQPPVPPAPFQPAGSPAPAPLPYGHQEPMPNTYLVWSILATILCCFIPGVVAIVFSSMVSSRYYAKDYEGARRASVRAQAWIIASVVLGLITATVYLPLSLLV